MFLILKKGKIAVFCKSKTFHHCFQLFIDSAQIETETVSEFCRNSVKIVVLWKKKLICWKAETNGSEEEINELLQEIEHFAERPENNTKNVLLIGSSGAGKSAFINTIHAALTGRFEGRAPFGAGNRQTRTTDLVPYVNCGVTDADLSRHPQEERMKRLRPRLPNILDFAGLGDEDSDTIREILQLAINGRIPPNTSINDIQNLQDKGALSRAYPISNSAWKVTTVVFVQSATSAIPTNLIRCLDSVMDDGATWTLLMALTRYDVVEPDEQVGSFQRWIPNMLRPRRSSDDPERSCTFNEYKEAEDKLARELALRGGVHHNGVRWVSYCDVTKHRGDNITHVNTIALGFLKRMMMPGQPVIKQPVPVGILHWFTRHLATSAFVNLSLKEVIIILIVLIVAIVVFAYAKDALTLTHQ